MPFGTIANETLRVCPQNGGDPIPTKGRVAGTVILITDVKIPLTTGDAIERSLPSGVVERFIVTDPGFHQSAGHGIPSHYQVKFRREDAPSRPSPAPPIHISGHHARVNISSTDNSTNSIQYLAASDSSADLVAELRALRKELLARAGDAPEQYSAIGAVATAESAVAEDDEVKAGTVLRSLGKVGEWVLSTAEDLGLRLASEYIKAHLG